MLAVTRMGTISILALLALSCASANRLAIEGDRELTSGNVQGAYDKARRALDKKPENAHAREVMTAAAAQLVDEWKTRIYRLAEVDTMAAAHSSLELRTFRGELSRYDIVVPEDSKFAENDRAIRLAAAGILYERGVASLRAGQPKHAWHDLQGVRDFDPGYRDSEALAREAFDAARTRVAILPFADQIGVPGLSQELLERISQTVGEGLDSRYPFTELIDPEQVKTNVTIDQLSDLHRGSALRIARSLGADRVVFGRIYGLRSSTTSDHYQETMTHRITEKDADGHSVDRYEEVPFSAVTRERDVTVRYDFEVVDVRAKSSVDKRTAELDAHARTVWTDFHADGDCGRYDLSPEAHERWKATFGGWSVANLLEHARSDRDRVRYQPRYRNEFLGDTRSHPVLLAELPSESELAFVALQPLGNLVLDLVRSLDPEELRPEAAHSVKTTP